MDSVRLDDLLENGEETSNSDVVLFRAVVLQALLDATKPEGPRESEQTQLDRRQAIAWFEASVGVTAQDFVDVCELAGLDPEYTRTFASKIIRTKEVEFVRKRINALLTHE